MSFRSLAVAGFAAAVTAFAVAPSQAAIIASLAFDQPTGVVALGDSIDVFFTLTLDVMSDALVTDASGRITSGFTDAEIIDLGGDPTDPEGFTYVNVFFQCGDTFTNCFTGPYDFTFNTGGDDDFNAARNLSLNPGDSISYRFGTFSPIGGSVPAGTYDFYNAGVTVNFFAPSLMMPLSKTIAETCPSQSSTCGFSRTVLGAAVPEPATWALMILGFGGAGIALRRRRVAPA